MPDYDDPEIEAQWLSGRREEISGYLKHEGVMHGGVDAEPAWHVAPYASVWAIRSLAAPASVGWWAISGDMPNDYVSASKATGPREAVQLIASLWKEAAGYMSRGEQHPTFVIGSGERNEELSPLLASRAGLLLDWAGDPEVWE